MDIYVSHIEISNSRARRRLRRQGSKCFDSVAINDFSRTMSLVSAWEVMVRVLLTFNYACRDLADALETQFRGPLPVFSNHTEASSKETFQCQLVQRTPPKDRHE